MQDDTAADFIRIPRPGSILLRLLRLPAERKKAQDRGDTITSVAAVLSELGRDGAVINRQAGDQW